MQKNRIPLSYWGIHQNFRKLLVIMKLTAILLIGICLHASATGYSQQEVTVSVKNLELKKFFNLLQKKTNYRFLYEDGKLPSDLKVNLEVENASIHSVLEKVLRNTSLRYKLLNNNLIVVREDKEVESRIIKGKILDENGQPLSNVSVRIKNSNSGTYTNNQGQFEIEATDNNILEISYIGYITQEIRVQGSNDLAIRLVPGDKNLEEVVMVGFGIQKKVNLTGAVDMITSKQLESRPIANVGAGLQGLIPNLNITQSNGRATSNPAFNIRGFTSLNGGDPLIVVDNVPFTSDEVARINPNDIETVTVLKDASSAAIYGARAAFGVVLITTKSAKGSKLNVSLNSTVAFRTVGKLPELVTDPYTVMDLKHKAAVPLYNLYPEAVREYAKQRSENPSLPAVIPSPANPENWAYFGSTNWLDEAYMSKAPTYNTNLSLSQKTEKLSYYLSGDYYQQDGLLKYGNDVFKRYNMRGKADLKITDWLTFSNNTLITSSQYEAPVFLDGNFFWNVNRTNPLDVPKNPDGTWTSAGASILGSLQTGGRARTRLNEFQTTFSANAAIIKNIWNIKADYSIRRGSSTTRSYDIPIPYKNGPNNPVAYTGATTSWARSQNSTTQYNVVNLYTDFHKEFGKHNLQALVGYNQEYRINQQFSATRNNIISTSLPSIGLSTGTMTETESIVDWAVQGIFYRLGYHYDSKYLLEFNGRYDGSSRFPQDKRWGFFPSASAGWVVSEESFFRGINQRIGLDHFKLRASYGTLGNQASVSEYAYIPTMSNGQVSYILGTGRPMAVYAPGAVSDNFSWEKISTVNLGVDLAFFKNRLQLNFDKYTRYTNDMLIPGKTLPAVFGTGVPRENSGDLKTKGWEMRLGWRDNAMLGGSAFHYNLTFTLADNRSWITRFDNPRKLLSNYYEGQEIGEIWGAEIEGFFQNEEDLEQHPDQRAMGTDDQGYQFFVGDPKFADRNKDGVVDMGERTVDNPGDLFKVGNSSARYPYGVDLSAGWKGFDLRLFFQGIGKRDWYPGASNVYFWGIFAQPWTNVTKQNLDHWTPENPNAYFPAVRAYAAEDNMAQLGIPNKRYMQNAAYMRMKNITLGYSLPAAWTKRLKFNKIRFYLSAENAFEISKVKVKLDPESLSAGSSSGAAYPFQRTYSIGLNLNY
ncbi:SusC/RagA family TonB-linked outer membrane protein [Flavihumibacter sp. UBA7668]|uniref:SusC/RagA family TonB-linked outer membrane protein n=1 Tax=Flavihumibacter sp. UBA7668 TaxID=1946542 RepID=UPI0025BC0C6E|nr:SusC/RagA family TonB-linked outer membrane protein [Flavihumibacter sp. UBA7668]